MGNNTRLDNWAAMERLKLVERALWWRGWIGRPDLASLFGISSAQASSDLQKYVELNPGAMLYQMTRKRYETTPTMACILHVPRLEDGIATFLHEGSLGIVTSSAIIDSQHVSIVRPPKREVVAEVERKVLLALVQGKQLRVKYHSVNSGRDDWRWITPTAFGHDGLRWHVRAWYKEGGRHQDFVLGRMSAAEWPAEMAPGEDAPRDEEWETVEEHCYQINDALSEDRQAALRLDYGTNTNGILKITCRRAMVQYVEAMLRVPSKGKLPAHFTRKQLPEA